MGNRVSSDHQLARLLQVGIVPEEVSRHAPVGTTRSTGGASLTDEGIGRAREALETYCIIERFLLSVLEVRSFRSEASELESVIDETVADRLDMIIDRRECPDCFSTGVDRCSFLEVAGDD